MGGGGGLLLADANTSKDTSLTCLISTLRGQKEKIEEDLTGTHLRATRLTRATRLIPTHLLLEPVAECDKRQALCLE